MATAATIVLSGLTDASGLGEPAGNPRQAAIKLANILWAVANGSVAVSALSIATSATAPVRASGTITISGGSGSVATTINGTAVTVTADADDGVTAGLLAAAVNANTTVNKLVSAAAVGSTVVVTAHVPGTIGGALTFVVSGTGLTVTGSGKLTGTATGAGSNTAPTTYSF